MVDEYDLILDLSSQILEHLREIVCRRALEYRQSARLEKKKKNALFLRKRLTIIDLLRPVVGGVTFSPQAPVLGPELKIWSCHPLPLSMAVCNGQGNTYPW